MTGYCSLCGNTACICCGVCGRPDCRCPELPDQPAPLNAPRGLRLGVLQEQRMREWPKERIRPKSVALGVLSLLAEVDALREQLAARTREPISHAEFSRFVQEAQEQRERADALQAELAAERSRNAPLRARIKEIQDRADREVRPLKAHALRLEKWADALVRTNCADYEQWMASRADLAERTRERDAFREGIRELVASVDAPGSFSSGPTQEQHDRTMAALAALRVLAARAAEGDGEG